VCHGVVGVVAAKCLHGGIVWAGEGQQACCSIGGAAAGPQWQEGMMEAAGVTLLCLGGSGIVGAWQ
jgi:hypothetical protein